MSRTKKIAVVVTAVALLATFMIGGTLAYFTDTEETTNVITMGKVNIKLDEPIFDKATDGTDKMTGIYPLQEIEKDPTVTVTDDSLPSYIRVKVEVTGFEALENAAEYLADVEKALLVKTGEDTYGSMAEAGWYKSEDGYFYYRKAVKGADGTVTFGDAVVCEPGAVIPVFSKFTVPGYWGNEVADKTFNIVVKAEAIQAGNFTPSENGTTYGWFYTDAENNVKEVTVETYKEALK